jgi:four helix bundle protein
MRYKDLRVWQLAMDLSECVHIATLKMPKSELYGLTSQMRRSAQSIPSNVAEGFGRASAREFVRFLQIANGSLFELETHIELVERIKLLPSDSIAVMRAGTRSVAGPLQTLIKGARRRIPSP